MPKRFRRKRKSKFVTRRALPFLLMKTAEAKFRDVIAATVPLDIFDTSPVDINLTEIAQGITRDTRIGQSIQITGVFFKCTFGTGVASQVTDARYARAILYSTRDTDLAPLSTAPIGFPDFDKRVIWSDKVVPLPWNNSMPNSMITIRKKFKPYMKCIYDGSAATSVEKNDLKIMISTDALTGGRTSVRFQARIYFRDL